MATEFETQLNSFQRLAREISPEFGDQVDRVVSANYLSQLGETIKPNPATTPATNTANKLAELVATVGGTYVSTVDAYLQAKLKVQQLKAAAEAERFKQAALVAGQQTAIGVGDTTQQYMPLIMLGGTALVALLILRK